jgi:hypothetical protein
MTVPRPGAFLWWRDCTCETTWCGYDDGCPMCQLLDGTLPRPRDEVYGVLAPTRGERS